MSLAHLVLGELARIGAKIEPAGTQLILRAGPTAIPAELVRRVRDAKSALIEILSLSGGLDQATRRWRRRVLAARHRRGRPLRVCG